MSPETVYAVKIEKLSTFSSWHKAALGQLKGHEWKYIVEILEIFVYRRKGLTFMFSNLLIKVMV